MRIAVVGAGISGMVAAHLLAREHEVTVYEANSRLGGHTHTVDVARDDGDWAVDTGFIVFNDWTYPNFIRLLDRLGVESQPSDMSLSVRCERSGLEYNGSTPGSLFVQRRNLLRASFHRMLVDIVRFNRHAREFVMGHDATRTMAEFIRQNRYSRQFHEHYLRPMLAAIWSTDPERVGDFPARFILRFFENHGLLNIVNRPRWRVIKGGSRNYIAPLTRPFRDRVRLDSPVLAIRRTPQHVVVQAGHGEPERYDHVVIAAHGDQALRMLNDATDIERQVLSEMKYQANDVLLHTDHRILPRRRGAWASWNYHLPAEHDGRVAVTYHMNRLQSLAARDEFCVTLNRATEVNPRQIVRNLSYEHPIFTRGAVNAQGRHEEISGSPDTGFGRTHYCGAYWGHGFHEDGVVSALRVASRFGMEL